MEVQSGADVGTPSSLVYLGNQGIVAIKVEKATWNFKSKVEGFGLHLHRTGKTEVEVNLVFRKDKHIPRSQKMSPFAPIPEIHLHKYTNLPLVCVSPSLLYPSGRLEF